MTDGARLRFLLDLAESLGVDVRRMPAGDRPEDVTRAGGDLVRLRGRDILFLDPRAAVTDRLAAVAAALAGRRELADRFLPPEIRVLLNGADDTP